MIWMPRYVSQKVVFGKPAASNEVQQISKTHPDTTFNLPRMAKMVKMCVYAIQESPLSADTVSLIT
ncbi:unnamed protein product [Chondrus crispus]|uniref:Uncharacterized protein n=1 Tax=Chondrus crispus TaxID=2769 RepID=R7QMH6_CHOCR|nr:unnamed protein product [Chondrus crispus]CDF38580.1 unnamed protein product [Chondrus crispus]|eukprot:XP_005718485.1 unnamed protein product [Chondrus crispus]